MPVDLTNRGHLNISFKKTTKDLVAVLENDRTDPLYVNGELKKTGKADKRL